MPTTSRTFRVFISSTFEDLIEERNALQRDVFPRLSEFCEAHGARFQGIDLRWGVRDEAVLGQRMMEICLAEIERCQRTRIKPNFIVLLGDRYGRPPLPARVQAPEFEAVLSSAETDGDRTMIESWYQRDDNAVPAEYLLIPRTGEFVDANRWKEIEERLGASLRKAARAAGLAPDALLKYEGSASHQEIVKGLGTTPEDRRHTFAFLRATDGAKEPPELTELKGFLRAQLGENVVEYNAGDIGSLCKDVVASLSKVILDEVSRFESRTVLELEVEAHDEFARERSRHFTGRTSVLDAITEYLKRNDQRPLVVHGPSGSGKTAIIAKASQDHKGIRRFIGATPEASNGLTFLRSLCEEIGQRYGQAGALPATFNELVVLFHDRLTLATADRPLTLYVDALDQLGPQDPAAAVDWLPRELPPHCHIVLSTIDLPATLANAEPVAVGTFSGNEAIETLDLWLKDGKRTLRDDQRAKVLAESGLPLYQKLAFEEARLWRSVDPIDKCVLGDGLPGIIERLFARLSEPGNHGEVLVKHTLGFLTAARYGLTENEMLDVLAASDVVWNDFERARRHDLPDIVRRLPVIVWSRLYLDLEPYLTERVVPGGTTISFYHRQLAESVAKDKSYHAELARYFGRQSNWRAPKKANERRITELLHQQVSAELVDEVAATATDLDFVSAKCAAGLVFDLQEDYRQAVAAMPEARGELLEESRRQEECARWIHTLINCAHERRLPRPDEAIRSVQPWTDDQIAAEVKRIIEKPTRLDRTRMFARFVEQEGYPLLEFGGHPEFIVQHAFNHSPVGPIHDAAQRLVERLAGPALLRSWKGTKSYNPKPALLRTLEGHTRGVWGVAVTSDGRRVVSGSSDNTLRVWDLETGACLRVLGRKTDYTGLSIKGVGITPDGRFAASAHDDRTVGVWDLETGECLRVLEGHEAGVWSVIVTPDGRRLLSGGWDHTLRLWDVEAGECLMVLVGHTEVIKSVSVTPDGRRAVSASEDKTVRVWDLRMGRCLRVLRGHTDEVWGITMTPDGRRAVSASDDRTVMVWDLERGECLKVLRGHTALVKTVSITPDGRYVVSAGWDTTLRIWDLEIGTCLRVLEGHRHFVWSVSVTPDSRRAVSASDDKTVRVWDLERGSCLPLLEADSKIWIESVSVMPDGRRVVSGNSDNTVRVWDLGTGVCLKVLKGHGSIVECVGVTSDGRRAVSGSWDGTMRVWDLEAGVCQRVLEGQTSHVMSVSVMGDNRYAVSGSYDSTVRLWDLKDGTCLRVLEGHTGAVMGVNVTPDSRLVVSASHDATLRVWALKTGECLHVLKGHTYWVASVSVTPDGTRVVSASWDGTLRVWDLKTGACLHVLEGHADQVNSVRVTPDGRMAVSGSSDTTLRMWDLTTGASLAVVRLNAICDSVDALTPNKIVAGTGTGIQVFTMHGFDH